MKIIKMGVYRHFKGGEYRVIGVAKHSETLDSLVIYEALYENKESKLWARPCSDFMGYKIIDGKRIKRFKWISK